MSSYGYLNYYKPPKAPTLAAAAASKDPYGLAPNNRSGPLGIGSSTGFAAPTQVSENGKGQATVPAARPAVAPAPVAPAPAVPPPAPPTASAVNAYDLNTDPALQQVQSLAGLNDEQAQTGALQQRQNLLLAYGDPTVASAILGASDPTVTAAGQNPTSTVAQLSQSRDRNLKTLDDGLNADNLDYSGYRVSQEQQAGQDYQNALAQAAAGLNTSLGTVDTNLTSALSANNQQRVQAIDDAATRAQNAAIASGTDPGATDPNALPNAAAGGAGGGDAGGATPNSIAGLDLATLLANAARAQQGRLNFSGAGV